MIKNIWGCAKGPKWDEVQLWHSYAKLSKIAKDFNFDIAGLPCTHSSNDSILLTGFRRLCQGVLNCLDHV